jgi:thiosulfate/3-mercaptopyruvate sulfurtransferase
MTYTTFVDCNSLAEHLDDPAWVIVDCRFELSDPSWGFEEYQVLHIPGAVYADLNHDLSGSITADTGRHPMPDMPQFAALLGRLGITPASQVVVYDATSGAFAARLWWLLRYIRHQKVAVLNGGLGIWNKENRPLESGITSRPAAPAYPLPDSFDETSLASTADVERIRLDPAWKLIDARIADRFAGRVEPIDPIAGRIPGAVNRFHGADLDQQGKVKSAQFLRQEFLDLLGGVPAHRAVLYCGSGVTSCLHLVAMQYAGLPSARLYLGSFSQWIRDPSRPIAKDG